MDLRFLIKETALVRMMMKPYVDYKRAKEYKLYQESKDSQYIKTFKNKYKGKRCFIIGNGPSLAIDDLNKLVNEYTFAANRIYNLLPKTVWRPTYYLSVDRDVMRNSWHELNKYELGELFLATEMSFEMSKFKGKATRIFLDNKFHINKYNDMSAYISEDVSKCFSDGYTVTFVAIQFAIFMGFKEIYLLGMDFNFSTMVDKNGKKVVNKDVKDHFYEKRYKATVPCFYDNNLYAYNVAKKYADEHGIKIYNATRGGKLEVFERVDFDEIIKK